MTEADPGRRAPPSATTTASGSTAARFLAEALGPGFDVLAGAQGAPSTRPGILNPGKLGLPSPFGAAPWPCAERRGAASSSSTSAPRASAPRSSRPDGSVEHVHHEPVLPDTPAPGLVEVDAGRIADAVLAVAAAGPGRRRAGRRGRHRQPAGHDRRVGPRHAARRSAPGIGWQDLRTVGDLPRAAGRGHPPRPQRVGHQARWPSSTRSTPTGPAPSADELCFGTIDTWVAWVLSGGSSGPGALHVTDATNAAVTGLVDPATVTWDEALLEGLRIPRPCCRAIVDSSGAVGEADALDGAPRHLRASPATSRPRWSGRAARARPGQGHLRHRRHARPVHRPGAVAGRPAGARAAPSRSWPGGGAARPPGAPRR